MTKISLYRKCASIFKYITFYFRLSTFAFLLPTFAFLLSSCSQPERILRVGMTTMPTTFDAVYLSDYYTSMINANLFEPLLVRNNDPRSTITTEHWYNPNDSTVVIKYSDGVRFYDGSLMTDRDIYASMNRILEIYKLYSGEDYRIEIDKDERLIYLHHSISSESIMLILGSVYIYKAEYLENFEPDDLKWKPMSTGPYYLFSYSPEKIVLKQNKFHKAFQKKNKAPTIVELIHEPNLAKQYQMLKAGELDFMMGLDYNDYPDISQNTDVTLHKEMSNSATYMMLDVMSDVPAEINLPVNPLKDRRVRQAMAHSIDTRTYIREQMFDQAHLLSLPVPRSTQGYPVYLEYYDYDIALAKSLMAEAGYEDGFEMILRVNDGYVAQRLAKFIRESLSDINITIEIDTYTTAEYDLALDINPASAFIYTCVHLQDIPIENTLAAMFSYSLDQCYINVFHIDLPHITELLETIATLSENTAQYRFYSETLLRAVFEETMAIPFFQMPDFYLMSKRVDRPFAHKLTFKDFTVER